MLAAARGVVSGYVHDPALLAEEVAGLPMQWQRVPQRLLCTARESEHQVCRSKPALSTTAMASEAMHQCLSTPIWIANERQSLRHWDGCHECLMQDNFGGTC